MIRTSLLSDAAFAAYLLLHPVAGGKGDNTIKMQEQQQQSFNQQLSQAYSTAFGEQQGTFKTLMDQLTGQVTTPTGFTAPQMAALNTTNTQGAATDFSNAQRATQQMEAARGGSTLPSGVNAQLNAQNANAGAAQAAQGSNQIALANASQQQSNYWNAISGMNTVAQEQNPNSYASNFNSGSSNVGSLGQAYNQTQQSQLLSVLGGVAGAGASAAGKALVTG